MSTILDDLPSELQRKARAIAKRDGMSIREFIESAVAEKLAAAGTVASLRRRKPRVTRKRLMELLAKAPDRAPVRGDELPPKVRQSLVKKGILPRGFP